MVMCNGSFLKFEHNIAVDMTLNIYLLYNTIYTIGAEEAYLAAESTIPL